MLTRSLGIASLVSITLSCLGCAGGRFSLSYYDREPRPVRVTHVHRHARKVNAKRMHPGPTKVKKVKRVHDPSCGCVNDRHGHK